MSLVSFHRGLIAAAILFCIGYGLWELTGAGRPAGAGSPVVGAFFILLGVGLSVYLARLNRFLGYESNGEGERR